MQNPLEDQIFFFGWPFTTEFNQRSSLRKGNGRAQKNANFVKRETVDYILFKCPVARFVLTLIRDICGLESVPMSCAELAEMLLQQKALNFGSLFLFFVCRCVMGNLENEE